MPSYKILLLLLLPCLCVGQSRLREKKIVKGDIYALIIGISDYTADEVHKDLDYAHKDAEEFRDYLLSPAGGSVPPEHIKLLTNDQATVSQIYIEKKWIEDQAGEDDLVYFYFSGHGIVEESVHKRGYLVAHDTPGVVYDNMAVKIEDINVMANTLSVEKDAEVIIITDACHSGKLSGTDNDKARNLGDRLTKVERNEIRIASCEADQLSKEDPAWGGGRGAFSFFLINGLKGLADVEGDNDGKVTLGEIESYLDRYVPDEVSEIKDADQNPVVQGKNRKKMAYVNDSIVKSIKQFAGDIALARLDGDRGSSGLVTVQDHYLHMLRQENLKDQFDFRELAHLSGDEILYRITDQLRFQYVPEISQSTWLEDLKSDVRLRNTLRPRLASAIHDEVQKAITAYLIGDKDEMEKRQYFNAKDDRFHEYTFMLEAAMKMVSANNYIYHMMKVKKHYFAGVAARLDLGRLTNRDSLIAVAWDEQQKALALDDKAVYIQNEIGILYGLKDEDDKALKQFQIAHELAPQWALPISNMANVYYRLGQHHQGLEYAQAAVDHNPTYVSGYVALGRNAMSLKKYLLAEQSFLTAFELNDRNYRSLESLGELYLTQGDFDRSHEYYVMAEEVKANIVQVTGIPLHNIDDQDFDGVPDNSFGSFVGEPPPDCDIDTTAFGDADIYARLIYARKSLPAPARRFYKQILDIDPDEPLSPYYLGQSYWSYGDYQAAVYYLELAEDNYLDSNELSQYMTTIDRTQQYRACNVRQLYKESQYNITNLQYTLAHAYRNLHKYLEAEELYRSLMKVEKGMEPYYLLWTMHEQRGLYIETESVINEYSKIDATIAEVERYAFYKRRAEAMTRPHHYAYQAAQMCYATMKNVSDPEELIEYRTYPWGVVESDEILPDILEEDRGHIPGLDIATMNATIESRPISAGIKYFRQALETEWDSTSTAAIYLALAEMSSFIGDDVSAKQYYYSALDYDDYNTDLVAQVTQQMIMDTRYVDAHELLRLLHDRDAITIPMLLQKAEYDVLSGYYADGDKAVDRVSQITTLDSVIIHGITLKKCLITEDYQQALSIYHYLQADDKDNYEHAYGMARIYAYLGDMTKATQRLEEATEIGFDSKLVLQHDPLIQSLSDTEVYRAVMESEHVWEPR